VARIPAILLLTTIGIVSLSVAARPVPAQEVAPSQMFGFDDLAVNEFETTRIRDMLRGLTHSGFPLDMHVTELAAGETPHPPHRHVHEEMLLIIEGELDVTVAGRTERLGSGSAAYVASNDEHGWRNVGSAPARYFVVALGDDEPAPAP
jgi:quercetin dioxygenase-like cupin family protein